MRSAVSSAVFFILAFFCISGPFGAHAQSRTNASGTGGIHEIRGRIYLPSGHSLDTPIEVELQSTSNATLKVYSDRGGSYSFQNLAPGNYVVVVNVSDQFEVAREYITLDTEVQGTVRIMPTPKIVTTPIYLQPKHGGGEVLKNEVVNAKWATVPRDAIEHYRQGLELIKQNKPSEAAAEFRRSAEISPGFAPAYTALGKLDLLTGKLDQAIEEFRTALRYDTSDFEARLNYGVALLNKKELLDARKELSQAAEMNKAAITPRHYLGILFIQTKELDAAEKEMEEARQLTGSKSFPLLHRYLGGIYMAKKLNKEAVAELETYIHQDPNARDADRIKQTISDLKTSQN